MHKKIKGKIEQKIDFSLLVHKQSLREKDTNNYDKSNFDIMNY